MKLICISKAECIKTKPILNAFDQFIRLIAVVIIINAERTIMLAMRWMRERKKRNNNKFNEGARQTDFSINFSTTFGLSAARYRRNEH